MIDVNQSVLVTGADGFIGSHLTEALLEKNYKVKALSYYNSFNFWGWLEDIPKNNNLEIISGDIRDPHFCKEISSVVIDKLEKLQSDFTKLELLDKKEFISERLDDVQNELNQAETKLKTFREQNLQISLSPTLLLHQERLQREIEIKTQIYISLKQQFEQVKIEEAQNKSYLKIIDPPIIPIHRSSPKRKRTVVIYGLMGFIIGGIIAVVKNYWEE